MSAAIVPLNIAALRVSKNDKDQFTARFMGRMAAFQTLGTKTVTTGDDLIVRLESGNSAAAQLKPGVHLHWELPDYFRRGRQSGAGGALTFPQAPNRWLVTRYLRVADSPTGPWGPLSATSWIVESDALAPSQPADRPAIPVPVPTPNGQPWQWLGRVVELDAWLKGADTGVDFLNRHTASDGTPLALTAIGFLGPGFSSYYPDCCSVFGFWDTFANNDRAREAIGSNQPVKFEASYQVFGWIDDATKDPLATLVTEAKSAYAARRAQCAAQSVPIDTTPEQVVLDVAATRYGWNLTRSAIAASVDANGALLSLDAPSRSLCAGTIQSVLWESGPAPSYSFLGNGDNPGPPVPEWTDTIKLAAGNTPIEALSALLKADAGNDAVDHDIADNDEFLLDALQTGLLYGIEQKSNRIADLEELLHARGFASLGGGQVWTVQPAIPDEPQSDRGANDEVTLPLAVAEELAALNIAQKAYDQGRAGLQAARRQLFLDWDRFVRIYTHRDVDDHVDRDTLSQFITDQIDTVRKQAEQVGVLAGDFDDRTRRMIGLRAPQDAGSLAAAVYARYQSVAQLVAGIPNAELQSQPLPPFWLPSEPVLLMQGDRIEPVKRNGDRDRIAVRSARDVIDTLKIATASINAATLPRLVEYTAPLPMVAELTALAGEARLTVPMFADAVVDAWAAQGGAGNPAVTQRAAALAALISAQGGPGAGLYERIRARGYVPAVNPVQGSTGPLSLSVAFTNSAGAAWAPDAIGWSAQTPLPEFSSTRLDPFLPVFLVWKATLNPLARRNGNDYTADNIRAYYSLGPDAIDLAYRMTGATPVSFTTGTAVAYTGSSVLSKRPASSLVDQIDTYLEDHPDDTRRAELEKLRDIYASKRILSQSLTGFSTAQTLRTAVPAIDIQDLPKGGAAVSAVFKDAIAANPDDNWYPSGFNNQSPIATGIAAQQNFGPLRGGLMNVSSLELVDVFGQRMQLRTTPSGIDTIPAYPLRAQPGDAVNRSSIVLPPRLLAPARVWFRWLSATHDASLPDSFVEMNAHPATSPVCGWILPNHLDDSLFFYDANGTPIGSFGLEHGDKVYRTRPGRVGDDLARDIAAINPHLADVMRHIDAQGAGFLTDLMAATLEADSAVHASRGAQDTGLAVLMGQPMAIARAVVGLETQGGVLPLSQADDAATDRFPSDVNDSRVIYADRQKTSSAGLGVVEFPLRLGDVANLDDGLVGYMIETANPGFSNFTSYYAPKAGGRGVERPVADSLGVVLNASPKVVTMLLDPRAAVHATTGILPVEELSIPPSQYSEAMRTLACSFTTHPVIRAGSELTLPLPDEPGYDWSWIAVGKEAHALAAGASDTAARDNYSPQVIEEGWLQLSPRPPKNASGTGA